MKFAVFLETKLFYLLICLFFFFSSLFLSTSIYFNLFREFSCKSSFGYYGAKKKKQYFKNSNRNKKIYVLDNDFFKILPSFYLYSYRFRIRKIKIKITRRRKSLTGIYIFRLFILFLFRRICQPKKKIFKEIPLYRYGKYYT